MAASSTRKGKDDNKLSTNPDAIIGDVRRVREQIAKSQFPALPLYFTEWSASYNPRDPVHDSYISAAYILSKLKATRAYAQGMSYWTYSDLFEEAGPPPTPFHGGFGLMNREGIRKPAWFAYKYLNMLRGRRCRRAIGSRLSPTDGQRTGMLLWDWVAARAEDQQPAVLHQIAASTAVGSRAGRADQPGARRLSPDPAPHRVQGQ